MLLQFFESRPKVDLGRNIGLYFIFLIPFESTLGISKKKILKICHKNPCKTTLKLPSEIIGLNHSADQKKPTSVYVHLV